MEIWKDIHGFKDYYQISNFGNLRSKDRFVKCKGNSLSKKIGKNKKQSISSSGYRNSSLFKNGKEKQISTHRLVGLYFVKGRSKTKNVINHKDGNKLNNNDWNLEWGSQKHNIKHSHLAGLQNPVKGDKHHFSKITEIDAVEIILKFKEGMSRKQITENYNLSYSSVCRIIKGTQRNRLIEKGLAIDINTL